MATKSDILAALGSLDPEQQDQWTEQGLPAMEVVKDLLGEEITRKELTSAAPLFNRETLDLTDGTKVQEEKPADQEPEELKTDDALEALRVALVEAEAAQAEARRKSDAAQAEYETAQRAYDKALRDLEAADTRSNAEKTQDEIMAVIHANNARKSSAAADRQKLLDAGLGPAVKELSKVLGGSKAPIDQSLKNRPRQSARPS